MSKLNLKSSVKDKLIRENQYLVKVTVDRLKNKLYAFGFSSKLDDDDLVGTGNIALIDAVNSYDQKENISFKLYAVRKIKNAINEEIKKCRWIPESFHERNMTIEKIRRNLQMQNNGVDPTLEEIAEHFDGTVSAIKNIKSTVSSEYITSLNAKLSINGNDAGDGDEDTIIDCIKNGASLSLIETELDEIESKQNLANLVAILPQILKSLPENERKVIELRYLSSKKYKLQDMDGILGLGTGYAYKLHKKAIDKIKMQLLNHVKTIQSSE